MTRHSFRSRFFLVNEPIEDDCDVLRPSWHSTGLKLISCVTMNSSPMNRFQASRMDVTHPYRCRRCHRLNPVDLPRCEQPLSCRQIRLRTDLPENQSEWPHCDQRLDSRAVRQRSWCRLLCLLPYKPKGAEKAFLMRAFRRCSSDRVRTWWRLFLQANQCRHFRQSNEPVCRQPVRLRRACHWRRNQPAFRSLF